MAASIFLFDTKNKNNVSDRDVSEENIEKKILLDLRGKFNYRRLNQTVFMY